MDIIQITNASFNDEASTSYNTASVFPNIAEPLLSSTPSSREDIIKQQNEAYVKSLIVDKAKEEAELPRLQQCCTREAAK